jgi:excisionase family DNA binding protein
MITAQQVAEQLQLSLTKVYDLARTGEIKSYRFGSAVRFDPKDVSEYITKCQFIETKKRVDSYLNLTVLSEVKESGLESSFLKLGINLKPTRMTGKKAPDCMPSLSELRSINSPSMMRLVST